MTCTRWKSTSATVNGSSVSFSMIKQALTCLLLFPLSYVVPKRRGLAVFCTLHDGGRWAGNGKYLFLYMLKRQRFSPVWLTKDRPTYQKLTEQGLPAATAWFKRIFLLLRAELILLDAGPPLLIGRFQVVQLWHGTGFKNIALLNGRRQGPAQHILAHVFGKYIFIPATSVADQERKRASFGNPNVFVTGLPRNDALLSSANRSLDLASEWGFHRFDKVILYAPTFRETGHRLSQEYWSKMDSLMRAKNWLLIVKRHPHDSTLNVPAGLQNIRDATSRCDDLQLLLAMMDVLITDYSGVAADFVLTDRPILFFIYDWDEYQEQCRSFYFDFLETLPGPFCKTEDQLLEHLADLSWSGQPGYRKKYANFKSQFHTFTDASSSARVHQKLVELLEEKELT